MKNKNKFTLGIIGRPNVGKSTLFNRIAGRRIAIIDDRPGVTRDRLEVDSVWDGKSFKIVDTAGYDLTDDIIKKEMQSQFFSALDCADFFVVVMSAIEGLHALDEIVVQLLRKAGKPFAIAVNKVDSFKQEDNVHEFYKLGNDFEMFPISALHGRSVDYLLDYIVSLIPEEDESDAEPATNPDDMIKVTVIGRPNVGKSSLINAWLGEERVIVTDVPGTTRDTVDTYFETGGRKYLLTDTAGIRKKSVMFKDTIEKYGYYRAMDSIERADIAVAVIDGVDGLNERDVKVIADAWEMGRPVVLAVNKCDAAEDKQALRKKITTEIKEKLQFLDNPPVVFISAKTGSNCLKIFQDVNRLFVSYTRRIPTHAVNEILQEALQRHQPPVVGSRRLKFFYMTQIASKPPFFVVFVNYPKSVHFSYERFLLNVIREKFNFNGVPIKLAIRARSRKSEDSD